jgi:hypothetical protein
VVAVVLEELLAQLLVQVYMVVVEQVAQMVSLIDLAVAVLFVLFGLVTTEGFHQLTQPIYKEISWRLLQQHNTHPKII